MSGEAAQRGWSTRLRPIEIGAQGFMARSAISLLSELGICGSLRQTVSNMSLAAERASEWRVGKEKTYFLGCKLR